jgi:hypothetical protein
MWEPEGTTIDADSLVSLEPAEILYEYAGEPLTFIARGPSDQLLLVHSLLVFDRKSRYLVSAVDTVILNQLKSGQLDLRGGLRRPRCWIADVSADGTRRPTGHRCPQRSQPPPSALPRPA